MVEPAKIRFELIKKIDCCRFSKKITIEKFCENIISTSTYWRYLNDTMIPSFDVIIKMCIKLEICSIEIKKF